MLSTIGTIGSIFTPILVLILAGIGWTIRQSVERRRDAEERLSSQRVDLYKKILEPFFILLMSDAAWNYDQKRKNTKKGDAALKILFSIEYRQTSAHLSLIGSDGVVKAYNNLMQHFYNQEESKEAQADIRNLKSILIKLGTFLLEIRKSMGNEATTLDNWSMLEWFITDIEVYKEGHLN